MKKNKDLVDCSLTKQGIITLTEELLHPNKKVPKEVTDYLSINIGEINTVNVVFFHEFGHIIQRQVKLDNNYCHFQNGKDSLGDFINPIIDNIDFIGKTKEQYTDESRDVLRAVKNTIHEGFSDLYSCFCIREVYGEEQAKKMIDSFIKAREKVENTDHYYTIKSMKTLLEDINNNKLNIQDFNDMKTYIYETIKNNIFKEIEAKFSDNSAEQNKYNSFFLGFMIGSLIERVNNSTDDYKNKNSFINFAKSISDERLTEQDIVNKIFFKYNLPQVQITKEDFNNGMFFVSEHSEEFKNSKELFKFKKEKINEQESLTINVNYRINRENVQRARDNSQTLCNTKTCC